MQGRERKTEQKRPYEPVGEGRLETINQQPPILAPN